MSFSTCGAKKKERPNVATAKPPRPGTPSESSNSRKSKRPEPLPRPYPSSSFQKQAPASRSRLRNQAQCGRQPDLQQCLLHLVLGGIALAREHCHLQRLALFVHDLGRSAIGSTGQLHLDLAVRA